MMLMMGRRLPSFQSSKISLVPGSPAGGPLNSTTPVMRDGQLTLTYVHCPPLSSVLLLPHPRPPRSFNPGRLDPTNTIWNSARKPLVAAWQTSSGSHRFITIDVHNTAKSSVPGSSTQGDDRPPVNLDVTKRTGQVEVIAVSHHPH